MVGSLVTGPSFPGRETSKIQIRLSDPVIKCDPPREDGYRIECGVIKASVVGFTNEYVPSVCGAKADDSLMGWSRTDDTMRVVDGS